MYDQLHNLRHIGREFVKYLEGLKKLDTLTDQGKASIKIGIFREG